MINKLFLTFKKTNTYDKNLTHPPFTLITKLFVPKNNITSVVKSPNSQIMKYKNILQIDDDYDDCDFFLEALREVSEAAYTSIHNPVEALKQLNDKVVQPDIIFLDINMPYMNGIDVLTEIKKKDVLKNIPVIIFSTSIPFEVKNKIKTLGAMDCLIKPNEFNTLKKILINIV